MPFIPVVAMFLQNVGDQKRDYTCVCVAAAAADGGGGDNVTIVTAF